MQTPQISRRATLHSVGAFLISMIGASTRGTHADTIPNRGSREVRCKGPFSGDGRRLLVPHGRVVRMYNVETGKEEVRIEGHSEPVRAAIFSPDDKLILTGGGREEDMASRSTDNSARLWNAATGREIRQFVGHRSFVHTVQFSPDGHQILTAGRDGTARIWKSDSGEQSFVFSGVSYLPPAAVIRPDGTQLLTLVGERGAVIWDTNSGQRICGIQSQPDESRFQSAEFHPLSALVITASLDRTVRIWDSGTGKEVLQLIGHTSFVHRASFSSNGEQAISASADGSIRTWDAKTGKELHRFANPGPVNEVILSADGRRFLARWHADVNNARESGITLWDADLGLELRRAKDSWILGFSPDGKHALIASSFTTLWDATSGDLVREFK